MALNFNINPYWDDFDETKNYHRILFKPGYAVQARELTQLQTALSDQIKKFGKHVFINGSLVLGGNRVFDNDLLSIKIDSSYLGNTVEINNFIGKTIINEANTTEAIVKSVADIDSNGNPKTLIVKITSGTAFADGELIQTKSGTTYFATIIGANAFASAMSFSIDSGVFFVDGKFIYLEAQSIPVNKYASDTSHSIGLVLHEEYISTDSPEGDSLLDRAQESPNYAAPGADRYKAYLELTVKGVTGASGVSVVENFVEIARIINGALVVNQDKTVYSEIGKELARRTFDESGDYTVKAWPIQILDDVTDPADPEKFTVALDPGKAYVKGFEFGTINQTFLTLDRARTSELVTNIDTPLTYGNFVNVTSLKGILNTNAATDPYTTVEMHNDIRTNVSGTSSLIGTAKVRYISLVSGDPGLTGVYALYLFDIVINSGKFFKDTQSIVKRSGASVLAGGNVHASSRINSISFLEGSDIPSLVFELPNQYIKTIRDKSVPPQSKSDYTFQRTHIDIPFNAGVGSIQTLNAYERFRGTPFDTNLSDTIKKSHYHAVIKTTTTGGYNVGDILEFNNAQSRIIKVSTPGSTQTATFDLADPAFEGVVTIIATIDGNQQTEKTKALSDYSIKIIGTGSSGGLNTVKGGKDSLQLSDIENVYGIYNIGSNNGSTVSINGTNGTLTWGAVAHTDVTSRYVIDNGQRAEKYDHGNLILNGTAPTDTNYLLVVYRNFSHTGNGYLSRDSYGIDYEDIPQFTDPSTGVVYNLRDCIDFRPRRADGNSTAITNGQVPSPSTESTFDADYQYYLARIDKIIATSDQQFIVKKGIPAIYPTVPTDESNGMAIYNVVVPPYTADIRDIQIKYIENRRYTMRDIGKLEKRIGNLEYYTQLSLLEKQAKDTSIPDASNFEKFKNGFIVDPFTSAEVFTTNEETWSQRRWGWWQSWFNGSNNWNGNYNENSIAWATSADFACAIDPINQELRSQFEVQFSEFDTSTLTNTDKDGDLVTLAYTETTVIDQPISSTFINVNPFSIFRFVGSIVLEPSFDQWVDTQYLPAVNKIVDIQLADAADKNVTVSTGGSGSVFAVTGSSTTTTTNVVGSKTSTLGTNVVDIQYIPFMRANTVLGVSRLFKPKARLYAFIENTPIDQWIKPLTVVEVQNHVGTLFDDKQGVHEALSFRTGSQTGTQTGTAKTALYSQPSTTDATKRLLYIYGATGTIAVGKYVVSLNTDTSVKAYGVVTAVTPGATGAALIPDEYGNLCFEFQVPANTFKTGERTIRLIDNSINDTEAQESIGETKYTAIGTLQTKQETILTTRTLQNQKTVTQIGYWYDPLGQTFLVDARANPQGFHLSSVDVFFKSKSAVVPVTMEIRRTVNGYPESVRTIPFSECILTPEKVNIQGGGTASTNDAIQPATTFNFANPIHLTPGEYAIVLVSQSNDYQVYISEMGGTMYGSTAKVDKQPYIGSLFKSQNASTWEADSNKDLKFKIKRANFTSSGTVEFNIKDPAAVFDYHTLFTNVSTVLPTGTNIVWQVKAYADSDWASFNPMQDINYSFLKSLSPSAGIGGNASLKLKATLTTENTSVSPVIDAASLSVVTAINTINNDPSGEAGVNIGGTALARYITKPINLAAGFEASNICVTVDINRPSGTDVKIYYRVLPTEKNTPIYDEDWVLMNLESTVPSSLSNYDFKEYRYFPDGAFTQYGVPEDNPIDTRFNTFQIKIVLLSTSEANTPRLKDLRIIALDS